MIIEACVNSIDSVVAAQRGGADRIELCENLHEGGTTPGYGMIRTVREKLKIRMFVIVRPRGGDFLYSSDEFRVMKHDIEMIKKLGADGIVSGILKANGNIDVERTSELVRLSRPLEFTFHRAFDMVPEPMEALEDVIRTGAGRILTSGMCRTAYEGATRIADIIEQARERIIIMPGGKVSEENISVIRDITGASEYHVSLRKEVESAMTFRNHKVKMGADGVNEYSRMVTDEKRMLTIRKILEENE